jgi:hypothetical protein
MGEKVMKLATWSFLAAPLGVALLLLAGHDSAAQVLPGLGVLSDTGMVTLAANQQLRITAVNREGSADAIVRFRHVAYAEGVCSGGACTHAVASQVTSAPRVLHPGEAASVSFDADAIGTRGMVLGSTPALRVLIEVVDGNTDQIIAILIGL